MPSSRTTTRRFDGGQVLGTVALIGCHHSETCGNSCSVWAEDGCWHWELADARAIPFPYPATGKLGLWNLEQPPNHSEPTTESHRADGT
jgi:hypothetical protein